MHKFIVILSVLLNTSLMDTKKETLLEIAFQDFFRDDTVSLNIEDCNVFRNLVVTSDEILGITDICVQIIKEVSDTVLIKYQDNEEICHYKSDKTMQMSVVLNGQKFDFDITPSKGKYIGFGKNNDGSLDMIQSKDPFEYE